MENTIKLGKDNTEHLVELIIKQCEHNSRLTPEQCYDDIVSRLSKYPNKGYTIVSSHHTTVNPTKIDRTENFQFFIDFPYIAIANKYF